MIVDILWLTREFLKSWYAAGAANGGHHRKPSHSAPFKELRVRALTLERVVGFGRNRWQEAHVRMEVQLEQKTQPRVGSEEVVMPDSRWR